MSTDAMIGTIAMFAGNFAPRGYALCQGQILSIAQNTALFSILGTTYGGNGQTTFALPDLRGRSPISSGQGPGLSDISLGEQAGRASVSLLVSNLPAHNHTLGCDSGGSSSLSPSGNIPGVSDDRTVTVNIYSANAPSATMNQAMVGAAGQTLPFSNLNPYLGINFIICTEGVFPSRN
jgi:microcystin-dependent protein